MLTGDTNANSRLGTNLAITLYAYDALNNLLSVTQKGGSTDSTQWRNRTFAYDSLSRLTSSTNPELNTVSSTGTTLATTYAYDANGNLSSKTSPAPDQTAAATVTLSYCYDALNRMLSKAYTAQSCPMSSPIAAYSYDQTSYNGLTITNGIGRRTGMSDTAGAEAWSYDVMGRVLTDRRTMNGVPPKNTTYAYLPYLDGSINTLTYPSTRVMTYSTGTAERLLSVQDNSTSVYYAASARYTPAGALSSLANGASLTSTLFFNSRLQPCRISVKNSGSAPSNCGDTTNKGNVLDFTYGFNLGSADNGNVAIITNNRDNTRSQNFTYDSLNRIFTAQTQTTGVTIPNSNCWGLTFGYDPWGNLLQSSTTGPTGCGEPQPSNVTVTAANRISGYCYDSAGNLLDQTTCPANSPHAFAYNAENQLTFAGGVTYTYDGDGRRVQKSSGKLYWYGMGSEPLDETDLTGNTNNTTFNEYIFFDGTRVARRDYLNNVNYYFADRLGTARVVTNAAGTILDDSDFYPFGGERSILSSSGNTYKFTGKEHDAESGLDDFGARYYSSSLGRFTIPDWGATAMNVPYADFANPQSLNLYSYVQNNPLRSTDPSGHCVVDGETHGWVWCAAHWFGLKQTKKEQAEYREALADYQAFRRSEIAAGRPDPELMMFLAMNAGIVAVSAASEMGGGEEGATPGESAASQAATEAGWVRVGRWMSKEELAQMEQNGAAVESQTLGGSRVALPASPNAYKDAPSGSVYVEYDVPAASVKSSSAGQGRIPGSNSPEARLAAQKGKPGPAMPPVKNIKVVKSN